MVIRAAEIEDLPAIQEIVERAYSHYIARMGKPPGPMLDDYAARITQGQAWVVELDGEVRGLLVLIDESDYLLLDNVAVHPAAQGHGLGRKLLDFAEAEARRRGYGELRLYTHKTMTENIALYGRLGWAETGRGQQAGYERVFMKKKLGDPEN